MARFIFITGGVVSSLGKGLASASLGALLQARGYKVRLRKLDPYLNVDPGTMSPTQHGEVFVTDDGAETDLDLGHYERFTDVTARRGDNVTAGQIYSNLLAKERRGDYLGGTVQVIPHVTNLIKEFVMKDTDDVNFILCEIGGTVGDIEALPFFESIRQIGYELGRNNAIYLHLTLVPYLGAAKELKTKPTQHSVRELRSIGIQPDILLCRAEREIPESERKKIALFSNLPEECVISGPDVKSIYQVPLKYHQDGMDVQVLKRFGLPCDKSPDLSKWEKLVKHDLSEKDEVNIAIVGKYTGLKDAYKSLIEALDHAGRANNVKVKIKWINSRNFLREDCAEKLSDMHGILVPGGFGEDGVKGKIAAVTFARENRVPFFGICYGMQIAVIEAARNLAGIEDATSSEFSGNGTNVVGIMSEWTKGDAKEYRNKSGNLGGTMRLGSYDCDIKKGTLAHKIYGSTHITERHRHRYEVNINYKTALEKAGLVFSGMSPDGALPEIIENPKHPWFVGVQFHPEFKSRPFSAHPVFKEFVGAAVKHGNK
jgi:CTP synthase